MRVRLEITVEVDLEAWSNTYGIDRKDVREDVQTYALTQLQESAASNEELWVVERPTARKAPKK